MRDIPADFTSYLTTFLDKGTFNVNGMMLEHLEPYHMSIQMKKFGHHGIVALSQKELIIAPCCLCLLLLKLLTEL